MFLHESELNCVSEWMNKCCYAWIFWLKKDQTWEYYHLLYYLLHTFSLGYDDSLPLDVETFIYALGIYADVAKQF